MIRDATLIVPEGAYAIWVRLGSPTSELSLMVRFGGRDFVVFGR